MTAGPGARPHGTPLPNDSAAYAEVTAHLEALAREPRPAGSASAAAGHRYCAQVLTSLGYDVAQHPFEYSAAVGELGTPLGGAAMLVVTAAGARIALGGASTLALGILIGGAALVMLVGRWAARHGVLTLPFQRRRGANLEARSRGAPPRAWLVAHIDSKSQPISLVVRAAGVVLLLLAWSAAVVLTAEQSLRGPHLGLWYFVIAGAVLGSIPVITSVVGRRSAGAVDNASGVATILAAARMCADLSIGVLITDAEELGLAGARAWCASPGRERVPVFNCDGVDDAGALTLMWTRPRAVDLEEAVGDAAKAALEELRVIPLIPGVLVDGLAFSDAGWQCVTLSRGSLGTLRRIHTAHDDLERLRGAGIAGAARILAGAARQIVERC